MHGLDKNIKEDPAMKAKVDAFKKQLREVRKREAIQDVVGQNTSAPVEKYLGALTCSRCHQEEYAKWKDGPHAHALASLESKSMESNQKCLQCHVTGFKEQNGYAVGRTELGSVSCEQCHGRGTVHGSHAFRARPSEESCMVCHDKANSPDFDYTSALAKVAH